MKNKRLFLSVFAICLFAICGISCSGDENLIKDKTNNLFRYMGLHDTDSLEQIMRIYPDFDNSYMFIESDSFKINNIVKNKNEDGYDVEITNYYSVNHMPDLMVKKNILLTFVKNLDGEYYIKKSVGLLNSDSMPVEATETGYLKVRSNDIDVDVIKELDVLDIIREESLLARNEKIKQDIKVELWYRTGGRSFNFYRVFNNSNEDINLITFSGTYTYETYPGYEFHNKGVAHHLRRNSYIDVTFYDDEFYRERARRGTLLFYGVYAYHYHLKSYEIIDIELADKEIIYQGNEYANYLKKHPKTKVSNEEKSKEEQFISDFENIVVKLEEVKTEEEAVSFLYRFKSFIIKSEYLYGIKKINKEGINESILKLTDKQKERIGQFNARIDSVFNRWRGK